MSLQIFSTDYNLIIIFIVISASKVKIFGFVSVVWTLEGSLPFKQATLLIVIRLYRVTNPVTALQQEGLTKSCLDSSVQDRHIWLFFCFC